MSTSITRFDGMQRCALAFAWLALLLCTACDPSSPCDPGYREEHNRCYKLPSQNNAGAGAGSGAGAGAPQSDASASESELDAGAMLDGAVAEPPPVADPYAGFGDKCSTAAECPAALVCNAPMLPICTRTNCIADPTICPPAWTCVDVTGLSPDPSVTSICLNF